MGWRDERRPTRGKVREAALTIVSARPAVRPVPRPSVDIVAHAFELCAAAAWTLIGLAFLIDPTVTAVRSPIGQAVPAFFTYAWTALYLAGGPLMIFGMLRPNVAARAAGLVLFATGLSMQGLAALSHSPSDPRSAIYVMFAVAALARLVDLSRRTRRRQ